MQFYKVLTEDRRGPFSGWQYPEVGVWASRIEGELIHCERGYHVVTARQLIDWLGPCVYPVDVGDVVECGSDKYVTNQVRLQPALTTWNDKTARLFAADCAEHVLPIFETMYPNDDRPRKAIQAARDYADGIISHNELEASRGAAWEAAGAAWGAAREASRAASRAAWEAASSAAWEAASAAWEAAGAAWEAAGAAWEAAGAAWGAAREASRGASRAASRGAAWEAWEASRAAERAAWEAERAWQTQKLLEYLGIEGVENDR